MRLLAIWVHLLGVTTWVGGLAWQTHVLMPLARRGDVGVFASAARRARPATWTAVAAVVLTGFYNVTRLGSLDVVMQSGAGLALAGKFMLVLAAVGLAAQRDFAQVPRLTRATAGGEDPGNALRAIAWLDRLVLVLAVAIVYLGIFVSRAGLTTP
jgi:putative copper export protein